MEQPLHTKLRNKRLMLHLDINDVAELLDIAPTNLYKWEKGTKPSYKDFVIKLEKFINGEFDSFVQNGRINRQKLKDFMEQNVNSAHLIHPMPGIVIPHDPNAYAIQAQRELIDVLKANIMRLERENKKLKESIEACKQTASSRTS